MFESVSVIGHGRVGSAVSARLVERGLCVDADAADLVLLCVPDRAIDWYLRVWPAAKRTTVAGYAAVEADMLLLFNKVEQPPPGAWARAHAGALAAA